MLWKYARYSVAGAEAKEKKLKEIEEWWEEFQSFAVSWKEQADLEVLKTAVSERLAELDERIQWSYFPCDGAHGLELTAEADPEVRPMVEEMVERAPKVEGWKFYPYRQPHPVADMVHLAKRRTGADVGNAKVFAELLEDGRIQLEFAGTKSIHAAFVVTEGILGEEMLDEWIGPMSVEGGWLEKGLRMLTGTKEKRTGSGVALVEFRDAIEKLKQQVIDALPNEPAWERDAQRGLGEGLNVDCSTPERQVRTKGREDQLFISGDFTHGQLTAIVEGHFSDCRFSKKGETWCFLKLAGVQDSADAIESIRKRLDEAIRKEKIGAVLGSSGGKEFVYIDLVLGDVHRAVPIFREIIRDFPVTENSWLLFNDRALCGEWIGVAETSPPPPHLANRRPVGKVEMY